MPVHRKDTAQLFAHFFLSDPVGKDIQQINWIFGNISVSHVCNYIAAEKFLKVLKMSFNSVMLTLIAQSVTLNTWSFFFKYLFLEYCNMLFFVFNMLTKRIWPL